MSTSIFDINGAFWMLCFGTFFALMVKATFFSKMIITKRGNELREEIKLTHESTFLNEVGDEKSKVLLEDMA